MESLKQQRCETMEHNKHDNTPKHVHAIPRTSDTTERILWTKCTYHHTDRIDHEHQRNIIAAVKQRPIHINSVPPTGVIAPSIFLSVRTSAYRTTENNSSAKNKRGACAWITLIMRNSEEEEKREGTHKRRRRLRKMQNKQELLTNATVDSVQRCSNFGVSRCNSVANGGRRPQRDT